VLPTALAALWLATGVVSSAEGVADPATSPAPDLSADVTLARVIALAVERSPNVALARAEWRATIERRPQVTALPDPMAMYSLYIRSVETRVGPQRHKLGFTQSFPYPGTLDAAGRLVDAAADIARANYEKAIRDVIVDTKISYVELAYLGHAAALTEQNHELLAHIATVATTKYAVGEATLADVQRAQSQLAQLEYDRVLLVELAEVERATLRAFLNVAPDTPLGEPAAVPHAPLVDTPSDLDATALASRMELRIGRLMVEKASRAATLAELKTMPMFKLDLMTIETGASAMSGADDSGKNPWTVGIGVSIPWNSDKNESAIREAEIRRSVAESRVAVVEAKTAADIRKLYFRVQNARRLVELYEQTLIPQAEQAMAEAEVWAEGSPKSVAAFLETQSVWLNFNLARLRALTDHQQNVARLERVVGVALDGRVREEDGT
jgi:outer membrane protein, heavy metal efflux system